MSAFGVTTTNMPGLSLDQAIAAWQDATSIVPTCRKIYYTPSQFPAPTSYASADGAIQSCLDLGLTAYICYKPAYNPVTTSDYNSMKNSLIAFQALGLKAKVILWQEVTDTANSGVSASQFTALMSYYRSAVEVVYPGCLAWDAAGSSPNNWAPYDPGGSVVDEYGIDFYAHDYNAGKRIDSFVAQANAAGKPLSILEMGIGSQTPAPSNSTCVAYLAYLIGIVEAQLAAGNPLGSFAWFQDPNKSSNDIIPGYASGQSGGPNLVPQLQQLANLVQPSDDLMSVTDSVTIKTTSVTANTENITDKAALKLTTPHVDLLNLTDAANIAFPATVVSAPGILAMSAPPGTVVAGDTPGTRPNYSPGIVTPVVMPIDYSGADIIWPVSTVLGVGWDTTTRVSGTVTSMKWNTLGGVKSTESSLWDTEFRVSSSEESSWADLFQLTSTASFGWNTIERISNVETTGPPVLVGPVVRPIDAPSTTGPDCVVTWNTIQRTSSTVTVEWNVRVPVKSTARFAWDIFIEVKSVPPAIQWETLKRVTSTAASCAWNARKSVSTTATCDWVTVGRAPAVVLVRWNTEQRRSTVPFFGFFTLPIATWNVHVVQPRVQSSRSFGWNTIERISATGELDATEPGLVSPVVHPIDYDLPDSGVPETAEWNTLKRVTSTASFGWNAVGRIPSLASCRWDTDGRISSSTGCGWNTTERYDATKSVKWNYLKGVTSTPSAVEWNTLKHITSIPPDIEWNGVGRIHSTATCEWNTIYTDPAAKTFRWNTLKRVNATLSCGWNYGYDHVTSTASCTWDVDERMSVGFTCEWVTLKSVVSTTPAIQWDVGQPFQMGIRLVAPASWSKME